MTTKEERYSREHKPSIKRESNHSASFDVILKNEISRCMKGFRATNVITYKRFRDKSTWLRPGEFANLVAEDEEEFRAEPKEVWPILQDMSIDLPVKELTKQHRVQDRYWTVPASNKKVRQPEPVYPQSTGVKLRPVEDIMNEYSKSNTPIAASGAANNTNSHKATPPQLPPSSNNNRAVSAKQTPVTHPVPTVASSSTPNASSAVGNSSTRTQDKNKRLMEPIPDKIKGVLQNLTDTTRRKPSSNTKTAKIYATKPNDKTTSVSSASKSKSVISPEKSTAVKKQQPLNVIQGTTASSARPRISSKSMPTEKTKYTENIPDLIEARKYLLGEMDEVECRSLKALQEVPRVTEPIQRPSLFFHFNQVSDDLLHVAKERNIANATLEKSKIKVAKATSQRTGTSSIDQPRETKVTQHVNKKSRTNALEPSLTKNEYSATSALSKSNTNQTKPQSKTSIDIKASATDVPVITTTVASKKSLSDSTKRSKSSTQKPKESESVMSKSPLPSPTPSSSVEKQAYPSSVSAAFLKSIKIPKRNNNASNTHTSHYNKSPEMELEEGETISPSPSPIQTVAPSSVVPTNETPIIVTPAPIPNTTTAAVATNSTTTNTTTANATATNAAGNNSNAVANTAATPAVTSSTTSSSRYRGYNDSQEDDHERTDYSRKHRGSIRRDEDKSSSKRDRYYEDNTSSRRGDKNRRTSYHRSRSRSRSHSRSRSPVGRSHRSESKNKNRSPSDRRRQTSLDHRRLSSPISRISEKEGKRRSTADFESSNSGSMGNGSSKQAPKHEGEPPAKRQAIEGVKTITSLEENKTPLSTSDRSSQKYTTNNHTSSLSSSTKNGKRATSAFSSNVASTPKSATTPIPAATATPLSSSSSSAHTVPDRPITTSTSNEDATEQRRVFIFVFKQLAHAHKRRGDTQTTAIFAIIDHFHALCDYMITFYFTDKVNTQIPFRQASATWKSLFPFTDSLLKKLEANDLKQLRALCLRLIALIRYYIYSRMESSTRPLLTMHLNNDGDDNYTDRTCIEMTEGLLREHEKAGRYYLDSEEYMTYGKLASYFPQTFKNVCIDGNISTGITLGGEADGSVGPMFPFTPYSPLHHAAIVSKCILNEYVTKKKLDYSPISYTDDLV